MKFKITASEETIKAEGRDVTFECPECSKRITTKFSEEQTQYLLEGNVANAKCGKCKTSFTVDSSVLGLGGENSGASEGIKRPFFTLVAVIVILGYIYTVIEAAIGWFFVETVFQQQVLMLRTIASSLALITLILIAIYLKLK